MYDVLVVGGGTAGSVLAGRLSEDPARNVCLIEVGPDYGPFASGRWPADVLDARALAGSHNWPPGGEDDRTLGGRILGGSSSCNACMIVRGTKADYDEWGLGWSADELTPFLDRAQAALRTAPSNTADPVPFHLRFLEAAKATAGVVDAAPFPANVSAGVRWNAALAYLEPARSRENLTIVADTLVDRVLLDGTRATGVTTADGRSLHADTVVLSAGAYFSPAILMRSGIGPEPALRELRIPVVSALPVGERLLDHHGTSVAWEASERLQAETADHVEGGDLYEAHAYAWVASRAAAVGSFDLHLLSWIARDETPGRYAVAVPVFHMKPRSAGTVSLRSSDPADAPRVERGYHSDGADLPVIVEGIEIARAIAQSEHLRDLLGDEQRPGAVDTEEYVRATTRNYFHPAGTCPIGEVVDSACRVLGVESLVVADASVMPTIPRANTNLTTAAIAERVATLL